MDIAPTCAAPYLGKCNKGGKEWLVFLFLPGETLEDLLVLADKVGARFRVGCGVLGARLSAPASTLLYRELGL